jgi:hypothetical protein
MNKREINVIDFCDVLASDICTALAAGDDVTVVMIRNGELEAIKGVGDVVVPTRNDRAGTIKQSLFKAPDADRAVS